jgi:hypothetical protein
MRIEYNGAWHACQPIQGWADQREQMRRHHLASLLSSPETMHDRIALERRRHWAIAGLCFLAAVVVAAALVMP